LCPYFADKVAYIHHFFNNGDGGDESVGGNEGVSLPLEVAEVRNDGLVPFGDTGSSITGHARRGKR
jgi:hypothetical protein